MTLKVYAKYISKEYLIFTCPLCYTKYKKNGEPTKLSKKKNHYHGSCGKTHNRTEHRIGHCIGRNIDFNIIVNDDTLRI
tara:strand:+ start:1455 stop:1691 length:237 start_codon:yes stop_codon:yes gene_type:complete